LTAEGFDAAPVPGVKGQFDVLDDGSIVFSKQQEGRFPEDGEVLGLIARGR
jgi:hypothetical protein